MKELNKILLVGCGELGSRHLQAIASIKNVCEIHIVDYKTESLELGKKRLKEITDLNNEIKFYWHSDINSNITKGDLCIIPTQSKGRSELLKRIYNELRYEKFLIEKVVTQSIDQYRDLLSFCKENRLDVWVNCKTRAYSIHKYIKNKLDLQQPIQFSDLGGNHGLGNNGIHSADLFIFYDESEEIKNSGSHIHQTLFPSKRGSNIFDLSGSLYGYTEKGSEFQLSYSPNNNSPNQLTILSPKARFIVDHFQQFAYESYEIEKWQWKKVSIDENWTVSHMSKKFVSDILDYGECELPTLNNCFPAHEFILKQLLPHFNNLLKVNNDYCPIT